jgi:hypothetical protein
MKTRTRNRDDLRPTPWVQRILGRIGANPLNGSAASPASPERIFGAGTSADALVIVPERWRDRGVGSSREGTAMKKIRFTTVAAVLVAVLALTAVVLLAGCGKEAGDVTTPTVSGLPAENTQGSPADVDAVMNRLATASPAEAELIWKGLPAETQLAITESQQAAKVEACEEVANGDRGSRSVTRCVYGYNALGQTVWSYCLRVNWTYDGIRVTSHSCSRWGQVYSGFWTFEGNVDFRETGGDGLPWYYAYTKGHFHRHLWPGGPVIQEVYPWVWIRVSGAGTSSSGAGS